MNIKYIVGAIFAFVVVVLFNSAFVITQKEKGVLLNFGKVKNADLQPGLHFKIPFIQKIVRLDARIITIDNPPQSYLTNEKKSLIVDSYIKWRIINSEKYYTSSSGNERVANRLISSRIDTGLRNKFGERSLKQVVSGERDELMESLVKEVNKTILAELGVSVLDIRIKRIDLPSEVSSSVFARMSSEREKEARELRFMGKEKAEEVRANADKEKTIIYAQADKEANMIKGDGDAKAMKIYSKAYSADPEFYAFYRTLKAYEASFTNKNDLLVLNPNGKFFKYLK